VHPLARAGGHPSETGACRTNIDSASDGFIDAAFQLGPDLRHESAVSRAGYADRIVRGGLPEAVARNDPRRRGRFFDAYVQNLSCSSTPV
jgi:hypothetical protein